MATATTDITNVLKYTYGVDRVVYIACQEVPLYNVLKRVTKDMGGRGQLLMPILKQNPGGWSGIVQGGTIVSPLSPATTEASYALKEFTGSYDVTWKLLQDARKSEFAFTTAIKMLDEGLRRRIFRMINADLLSDGRGQLAALSAADNVDPITSRYLPRVEVGQVVDFMDDSDDDTALLSARTVTAVDPVARTVTLGTNAAGTAANDYVVIQNTSDISKNSGACLHTNGILGVIDDGTTLTGSHLTLVGHIGGINRATAGNEFWKSVVLSNSGTLRTATEDLFLQAEDSVREKGGANLTHWFSNLAIGRRYHEQLRADTFYQLGSIGPISGGLGRANYKGAAAAGPDSDGKSPYEFGGVSWYFDPFFDSNTVVGFDKSHFFIGVGDSEVPRPESELFDGVPMLRQGTSASYQVVFYWQANLVTDNPAAGVKILDIAES